MRFGVSIALVQTMVPVPVRVSVTVVATVSVGVSVTVVRRMGIVSAVKVSWFGFRLCQGSGGKGENYDLQAKPFDTQFFL